MKTEFTTFRVTQGKEALAREWMNILKERKSESIETLGRKKMLYESLFSYQEEGRMFLSWFSVLCSEGGSRGCRVIGTRDRQVAFEIQERVYRQNFYTKGS